MSGERDRIAAILREHQPAGYSGHKNRPHRCKCGHVYRAGELPDHQAERITSSAQTGSDQ